MMEMVGETELAAGDLELNDSELRANLNISDVFEAISIADPSYGGEAEVAAPAPTAAPAMYPASAPAPATPYVRIVEQPASKALRFRYECEGRSAGSIPGVNSTAEKKSFPAIEICGHRGRAIVVVSCVTKDKPYRPHPHNLVGRELCKKGVCTVNVSGDTSVVTFSNLGIQCVKRKDIGEALKLREGMRVDPFKTGFGHKNQPQSIDLNAVRLCFQVFLPDEQTGKVRHALPPVVSDVIYDKKAMSELLIMRLSRCSGPARGGTELILLCEKVTREDTAVVFFQKENEQVVWEDAANIILVHKQVAIAFYTPPYLDPNSADHVQVYIQLKRLSDDARSPPVPFEYIPEYADMDYLKNKKRKTMVASFLHSSYEQDRNVQDHKIIKTEDKTPPHQMNSPQGHVFSPSYLEPEPKPGGQYQQWTMSVDNMQGGLAIPGPSLLNPFTPQEVSWAGTSYAQAVPTSIHSITSNIQAMPNMSAMSPIGSVMSPNMGQAMSPLGQAMSPLGHGMSSNMGHMSPNLEHINPNMVQQVDMSQMCQENIMDSTLSDTPSITGLLMDRGEGMPQLNSAELSGLSSLLGDRPPDLSDSLNRLSTTDLLQ